MKKQTVFSWQSLVAEPISRLPAESGFFMSENIESRLQELRKLWTAHPELREKIELQVRVLEIGLKTPLLKPRQSDNHNLTQDVQNHLL